MEIYSELCRLFEDEDSFGLDFGTARSYLAVKEAGSTQPEVIVPDEMTCRSGIPSLFWRHSNAAEYRGMPEEMLCGDVLRNDALAADPEGVVQSVKMKLMDGPIVLHDKTYQPEEIAVQVVKRILSMSVQQMKTMGIQPPAKRIVAGVPVRFGAGMRGKLMQVMKQAMPELQIALLPEPSAAALFYQHSVFGRSRTGHKLEKVVVYDLGAGTFDCCALLANDSCGENDPSPFRVLSPDGMRFGGDDLDTAMEELILRKLRQDPQKIRLSVLQDKNHRDRRALRKIAQEAKEGLSSSELVSKVISGVDCGSAVVTITRGEFESAVRAQLEKTVDITEKVIREAGLWNDREVRLLLVGGSSYIPLVQQLLGRRFSWLPAENIFQRKPDQAVALGCALYAANPNAFVRRVAFGYAVRCYRSANDNSEALHVRIPANADLPYTVTESYLSHFDNAEEAVFWVYEVPDATVVGELVEVNEGRRTGFCLRHPFGRKMPRGTRTTLTVTLTADGILRLSAQSPHRELVSTAEQNMSTHLE